MEKYPTVGQHINKFIECFGKPLEENRGSNLNRFDLGIEGASYFITTKDDEGNVIHISFSLELKEISNEIGMRILSDEFIPYDISLVQKVENKIFPLINGEDPISIFEYHSNSMGAITKYFSVNDGVANFVVSVGKEPLIN